ncbi:unnamed protein product, partial [Effrenium voratum]
SLNTRFVHTWRFKRVNEEGKWLRRARLVAKEFKHLDKALYTHHRQSKGWIMCSFDVHDAYLTVDQKKPTIITTSLSGDEISFLKRRHVLLEDYTLEARLKMNLRTKPELTEMGDRKSNGRAEQTCQSIRQMAGVLLEDYEDKVKKHDGAPLSALLPTGQIVESGVANDEAASDPPITSR